MRNTFYKNSRFKSSDHWIPAPADHQVAHLFFSGLSWMGSSEAEIPGKLLSYSKGSKPLSITAAPPRADQAVRSDLGRTRGSPRRVGNARTPTEETRLGIARAHLRRAPRPLPLNQAAGKGTPRFPGEPPWLRRDAVHLEPSCPHTHSPAPRRSSRSPRSQQLLSTVPLLFPPPVWVEPDPAYVGPDPAYVGSEGGASQAGPCDP